MNAYDPDSPDLSMDLGPFFDAAQDLCFFLDTSGVIRIANVAAVRTLGKQLPALVGQSLETVFCPAQGTLASILGHRIGLTVPGRLLCTQGGLPGTLRLSPCSTPQGDGLIAVLREQPEPKRGQEEVLLGLEGLVGLSHDLRAPLNSIMGMAQLLMETGKGTEQGEYLSIIMYNARQLLRVVNLLLDLGNLEMGSMMFMDMPFSPEAMLSELQRQYEPKAKQQHVIISVHAETPLPESVLGDSERCMQLLSLLLDMALLSAKPGNLRASMRVHSERTTSNNGGLCGTLRLQLEHMPRHPACDSDALLGPSPDDDNKTRTDAAMWMPVSGLEQLYLAVASRLARRMGGRLERLSRHTGDTEATGDCAVAVELPVQLLDEQITLPAAAPAEHSPTAMWKVLLVEDEPVNQLLVEKMLTRRGHTVVSVGLGEEALAKLKREAFDVVLMDLHMPGINGLEATRRIRSGEVSGASTETPVVALTIFASPADQQACEDAGMDGYVLKPFETPDLLQAIQSAIGKRSA